jgi:hypothetical protein
MHDDYEIDDWNTAARHQPEFFLNAVPMCVTGILLLLIVFFAPDAGQHEGVSFFQVAKASDWRELGDWPAAWCSLKIVFLSFGIILILDFLAQLASWFKREFLALALSLLTLVPALSLLAGVYFLVKAVL